MHLRRIALQNFKCFESVDIDCSKITILTGANSSGKSALIYSVLGAVQTKNFPFYFSPNGTYANMGDFVEIAYNHKKRAIVGICLELAEEDQHRFFVYDAAFSFNNATKLPRLNRLHFRSKTFDLSVRKNAKYLTEFHYRPQEDKDNLRQSETFREGIRQFFATIQKATLKEAKGRKGKGKAQTIEKFMKEAFDYQTEGKFHFAGSVDVFRQLSNRPFLRNQIQEITGPIMQYERSFNYISSFRLAPERTYYEKTKAALRVDNLGQNWVDQIVEWEQSKSRQLEKLKIAARRLKLLDDLRSMRYAGGRFEIRVIPHHKCIDASLADVGFGISQFLPILVADAQLGKRSTLFMSQPEIHLHPSVQAEFANYLSDKHRTEKKRYVIETHSEYLLNRFRVLIAKGEMSEDDVAVYYLNRVKGRAKCHKLVFRKDGKIEGAPKEFFGTYMMDVMNIAMHA